MSHHPRIEGKEEDHRKNPGREAHKGPEDPMATKPTLPEEDKRKRFEGIVISAEIRRRFRRLKI